MKPDEKDGKGGAGKAAAVVAGAGLGAWAGAGCCPGEWLNGTDEGDKRWWLVLKVVVGVVGLGVLVYIQVAPHLTR